MKKLLSILGSIGLVATSSMMVVSCGIGDTDTQSSTRTLQRENFLALNEIAKAKSLDLFKNLQAQDFFYSNGATDDNKVINPYDNANNDVIAKNIAEGFGANDWGIIDTLNRYFNLGIKRAAKTKSDFEESKTYTNASELEKEIDFKLEKPESLDNLKKVTVNKVDNEFKQPGEADTKAAKNNDIVQTTFDKISNLGNTKWWEAKDSSKPAWKQQQEFLDSEKMQYSKGKDSEGKDIVETIKLFDDRIYQQKVFVTYGGMPTDKNKYPDGYVVEHQIWIKSANSLKPDQGNFDGRIDKLKSEFEKLFNGVKFKDSKTLDEYTNIYLNHVFEGMNPFAEKQTYGTGLEIDSNFVFKAIDKAEKNLVTDVNDYINKVNQKVLGDYLIKHITWSGKTKSGDPNPETNPAFDLKELDGKLIDVSDSKDLAPNDFLTNELRITKDNDLTKIIDSYKVSQYQSIEDNEAKTWNQTWYSNDSKAFIAKSQAVNDNAVSMINKMIKNANDIVFTEDLNEADNLSAEFNIYFVNADGKVIPADYKTTGISYNWSKQ